MSEGSVLITGADGYLGSHLIREYVGRTRLDVVLALRASSAAEFAAKRARLETRWSEARSRLRFVTADLTSPLPMRGIDPEGILEIVHAAGVTQLNVAKDLAQQVNVEGTATVCAFARRCRELRAFGYVSSVYASGLRPGPIGEAPCDDTVGFANHYEWSKNRAESVVIAAHDDLPWRVFRVATIVANGASGQVAQFNAFHNTMKLLRYGLLSLVPGDPRTPLYFVAADFAARAIVCLMQASPAHTLYHICHTRANASTLGELVDLCFEMFRRDPGFASRRVLKPLFCDARSFQLLRDGVSSFGGTVLTEAISSVAPFAAQLFVTKEILNDNLRRDFDANLVLQPRALLANTCAWLVRTRFGREEPQGVSHAR